jgi:NADH-quinone oxidoreductase subunit M
MLTGTLIYLVFLPAVSAALMLLEKNEGLCRVLALIITGAELAVAALLFYVHSLGLVSSGRWFLYLDAPWITRFGIRFSLGMDGISLLLVTLSALLFFISVIVSWREVRERVALFHSMLLLMEAGVIGVFLATDLFLFYLFWELMLIPMFFIIGVWGHGRRVYSAVKFFIFTVTGSLLMLLSIIGLYVIHGSQTGVYTFALADLVGTQVSRGVGLWLFAGFLAGFAVKVPVFPLHTWLPDAHTDAPTAGSVILAGLLLKTGAYGLLRFALPLLPQAASVYLPFLFAAAIIGIFYASWVALAQSDMKRLIAYSSVAHLAYVVLGISAWNEVALAGSVLQMVNHGITTGALFMMVGMMDARVHTREISAYGGLWTKAPVLSSFFLLFVLSSLGLPGLNNFAGEFLILVGLFRAHPVVTAAGFAGLVAGLIYLLHLAQKLLLGPVNPALDTDFKDLSGRELVALVPLAALVIIIGVYPALLLKPLQGPVKELVGYAVKSACLTTGGMTP